MADKKIVFTASVRGFHVYRASWNLKEGECLNCFHEENNPYDIFSVKLCTSDSKINGHLPMEIPRITKPIIQQVATNTVKVAGKHYRQSPLVQGGL